MSTKALMIQGTMSSAGKSLLVTGLCRLFARRGVRVAPFKAQNMSNNAAVCPDGSEIGRAQYTQALACDIEPSAEMNPILLKPEADARSQVVVMGKARNALPAREYYQKKTELWQVVTQSLNKLRDHYELVIIEGAGSPVELNLKQGDIVNMAVAKYARAPVILAGDIDRGGIFAQLLGTLWLLEPDEQTLVKGLIVNKFRGDISLFTDGVKMLEELGGVPVLGVVPYMHHYIPEEDAVAIEPQNISTPDDDGIEIVVIRLPRISNFDDFDPLKRESGVRVRYVDSPSDLGCPAAVILPGTKSTMADRQWLRERGLDEAIRQYADDGGAVVGICGGYQMLGTRIADPEHTESDLDEVDGLGLLTVETVFKGEKATHQATAIISDRTGWLADVDGQTLTGYEIHVGRTGGSDARQWLNVQRRDGNGTAVLDGAISAGGRIWGCYLHGLFDSDRFRRAWLESLGWQSDSTTDMANSGLIRSFDKLADVLEGAVDMDELEGIIWKQSCCPS